jgi:lysine-specific demethylase 8
MQTLRRLGSVDIVSELPDKPVTRAPVQDTVPVIIRGENVVGKVAEWTPEHISERLGERDVPISIADADGAFRYNPDMAGGLHFEPIQGAKLAAEFRGAAKDRKLCMQQMPIETRLPELFDELTVPPYVPIAKINDINLWMASADSRTPLHYDDMHNIFAQIEGRKRFRLFNPAQFDVLYPGPLNTRSQHLSQVDLNAPDLRRFPKFAQAEYWEAVVTPGDMLFMPAFWWHQVSAPDLAVSVNYWWRADVRDCLIPGFFRQLHMNMVMEDVHNLFRGYDLDGLGVGSAAVLALAELALDHGETSAAARLCGATVVGAARDAGRGHGLVPEDMGIEELLERLVAQRVWSAQEHALARQALTVSTAARPSRSAPAEQILHLVRGLTRSGIGWAVNGGVPGGTKPR